MFNRLWTEPLPYEICISFCGKETRLPGIADRKTAFKLAKKMTSIWPGRLIEVAYDGIRQVV